MRETVYAWLIVNGFIHSEKFQQIFDWLVSAAEKQGCILDIKTNTQLLTRFVLGESVMADEVHKPKFAIFWDKDIRLARLLEKAGIKLFNSADSIEICDDKARTYLELLGKGIRMPRTIIAPKTFQPEGFAELDFLIEIEQCIRYPMIIKECYGSFGQQVYLVQNREETISCLHKICNRPCLFQEFVASSRGRDVRIQMVGDQAVASMYRFHEHDFRANITNGGSMEAYHPSRAQIEMAQKVMKELRLDFAGVDILFGEEEEPVLCEVNSNAHFVNIWKCTGVNAADEIIRYCLH